MTFYSLLISVDKGFWFGTTRHYWVSSSLTPEERRLMVVPLSQGTTEARVVPEEM